MKQVPNRADIVKYGAWRLFSTLKSFLNERKMDAKINMFEEFLYMFAPPNYVSGGKSEGITDSVKLK